MRTAAAAAAAAARDLRRASVRPRDHRRAALSVFARYLRDELLPAFGGTKAELADAIGVTPSTLSHMLAGRHVPGIEVCLRMASVCHQPPGRVLRLVGRTDLADLLDGIYGTAGAVPGNEHCTPQERRILRAHRLLDETGQRLFEQLYYLATTED